MADGVFGPKASLGEVGATGRSWLSQGLMDGFIRTSRHIGLSEARKDFLKAASSAWHDKFNIAIESST